MDPTPWVGAGSVVALMALAISFVTSATRGQRARIKESEQDERWLQQQLDRAVRLLRENNVAIPADFWDTPADRHRRQKEAGR